MRSMGAAKAPQLGRPSGPATSGLVATKRAPRRMREEAVRIMSKPKDGVSPSTT